MLKVPRAEVFADGFDDIGNVDERADAPGTAAMRAPEPVDLVSTNYFRKRSNIGL